MTVSDHRTQVYFPNHLHGRLRSYARRRGISVAEAIRQAVENLLEEKDVSRDPLDEMIGAFESGVHDASVEHDRYIYGRKPLRFGSKE